MTTIWWALAALALILAVRALAERLRLPAAVLLVLAGLAVAVLPVPTATLHPELILHGVIPPLLFVAARDASLIELRGNLRLIGSLSVALVAVTALVTGAGLVLVVGGLGFAAAVAIGAAMAPPDPVAALAIGRRAGLPRRLTTVIEGEGLLNDATALTIYGLAVTAAVGGGFSVGEGIGRFLLAVAGGVVVGLLVARLASVLERVDDDLVVNAVSLATPFLAFAAAEQIHGSGVLAVVIAGLVLGHRRVQGARRGAAADRRGLADRRVPAGGLRLPADRRAGPGARRGAGRVRHRHGRRRGRHRGRRGAARPAALAAARRVPVGDGRDRVAPRRRGALVGGHSRRRWGRASCCAASCSRRSARS